MRRGRKTSFQEALAQALEENPTEGTRTIFLPNMELDEFDHALENLQTKLKWLKSDFRDWYSAEDLGDLSDRVVDLMREWVELATEWQLGQ